MLLRKPMSNVTLFSGKDYDFRAQIMYYLALNPESTTWDISLFISKDEIREQPSHKSMITKSHSAGVFRNIKERMIPEVYVRKTGIKFSKGNRIPTYGLSFRGSLVVLSLNLQKGEQRAIVENNTSVNPFYKLILTLEKNGVEYDMCSKIILQGLIKGIKDSLINISTKNESIIGQSVIPALFLHLSSVNKPDLKKLNVIIKKIIDSKNPKGSTGVGKVLTFYASILINPLFWTKWNNDEIALLSILKNMISETLDYSHK